MNLKKVISIFASLALTVSCFASLTVTVSAEDEIKNISAYASASAYTEGSASPVNFVYNENGKENPTNLTSNTLPKSSTWSAWQGIGIVEFELPAVDPNRIKGAELKITVHNGNAKARLYKIYQSSMSERLSSETTYENVRAARSTWMYDGANINANSYRNDTVTNDAIVAYVKSKANAEGTSVVQFVFSDSAQPIGILMAANAEAADSAAPVLTLTLADESARPVKYTVKHQLADGTEIKSEERDGFVGTEVTATDEDKQNFNLNDKKYIYVSGGDAITPTENASENIIAITVREAAMCEMKVVPSTDATKILKSASVFEGDDFSYSYSKYLTDVNKKVIASAKDATYAATIKPTESATITIPYTAYEGNAWFVEGEEITDTNAVSDNRLSGGIARRNLGTAKEIFTISEDGVYDITFVGCTNRVAANYTCDMSVYNGSAEAENLIKTVDLTGASVNKIKTEKIATGMTLKAGDKILVKGNDSNPAVDYILFEKTGNIAPEIITGTVTENAPEISTDTTVTAVTANAPVFDKTALGVNVIKTISVKVDNSEENVTPVLYVNDTAAQTIWTADENGVYYAQFAVPSVGDFADFGTVKVVYGSGDGAIEKTINITE